MVDILLEDDDDGGGDDDAAAINCLFKMVSFATKTILICEPVHSNRFGMPLQ